MKKKHQYILKKNVQDILLDKVMNRVSPKSNHKNDIEDEKEEH